MKRLKVKISEGKNKFFIAGDKTPQEMSLPILMDVLDLEIILNDMLIEQLPKKKQVKLSMKNRTLEVSLGDKV